MTNQGLRPSAGTVVPPWSARHRRTLIAAGSAVTAAVVALGVTLAVVLPGGGHHGHDDAGPTAAAANDPTGQATATTSPARAKIVPPKGATGSQKKLEIPVGSAKAKPTLTIYEDPRCSACGSFEATEHPTINRLVAEGRVKIRYHLVQLIDGNLGGNGSLLADNALACAQDAGHFRAYHDVLYANQPSENDDAFGDDAYLISLARRVEGLDTPRFEACVNSGTHLTWARAVNDDFDQSAYHSTPTVLLDGTSIYPSPSNHPDTDPLTPRRLVEVVARAAKSDRA